LGGTKGLMLWKQAEVVGGAHQRVNEKGKVQKRIGNDSRVPGWSEQKCQLR